MPENFNDGWVAEVDGEELTPVRVDGWQQGWVLPAGEQVTVELRYRPQATYDVILPFGLAVGGAFLLGALAIAMIALVARLRGRRPEPAPDVVWPAVEPTDRVRCGPSRSAPRWCCSDRSPRSVSSQERWDIGCSLPWSASAAG